MFPKAGDKIYIVKSDGTYRVGELREVVVGIVEVILKVNWIINPCMDILTFYRFRFDDYPTFLVEGWKNNPSIITFSEEEFTKRLEDICKNT